jgi:hypothetical protein
MTFLLSYQNVLDYLIETGFCSQQEKETAKIEPKLAKNFNLLVSFADERMLLVKQEPHDRDGKADGEFLREWRISEFVRQFPEASHLRGWLPEILHFDRDSSLIIVKYLDDYENLAQFYSKENIFPTEIANSLGAMLAEFHSATFKRSDSEEFFASNSKENKFSNQATSLAKSMERLEPEIFGQYPADGVRFLKLYQRFDSLGSAIATLGETIDPCCLTHNDLKLNNLLVPKEWKKKAAIELKLIDWERCGWGDPAFDLGMLMSSYLTMWLASLVVSNAISIEEGLRMAMTPLELIQPSNYALIKAYLTKFPEILEHRPDFLLKVMQFAGLGLIQVIQSTLQYEKSFNNSGICMLQVAKTLLCRPEAAIANVLGNEAAKLVYSDRILA